LGVRGRFLGSWRPLVVVEGCEKILPEFQEGRMGGWVNAAESAPHYIWGLHLDLRSKCSV
jgi:hypothetical protein